MTHQSTQIKAPSASGGPRSGDQPADCYYLESIEQLQTMADPIRYRIIKLLDRPKTGAQLARALNLSRAKTHYHLKQLEAARLVVVDHTDLSTGMIEKYYACVARFFSFSRLLPETSADPVLTAASYKAVADFLSATFEVSRDMLASSSLDLRRDTGIWMEKSAITTRENLASLRQKVSDLRDEILALDKNDHEGIPPEELISFNAMLFLTPAFLDRDPDET